jgi:D-xylose transport system substrate-binding protein
MKNRLWAFLAVLALVVAACGDDAGDTTTTAGDGATTTAGAEPTTTAGDGATTTAGGDDEIVVGVSWNNYNEERWAKADEPAIQAALEAAGASYISTDAGSSAEQQLADVENLISQGADALIILAQDGTAILPAVASALEQGIPVIGYDRLIEDPGAFYLTFDNIEVGRMQARAIFELVPEGNYVFIKGNQADANADFLFGGQLEILQEAIDSGAIVNVGESYTDNWDPAVAQTNMEQFLTQNNNDVDAVVASNDGMAGGVVAALEAQGLAGTVPVSGQDGDAAALNRVALGTQSVSVWKNAYALGQAAGEIAVQLAQGTELADVQAPDDLGDSAPAAGAAAAVFTTPGGNDVLSIILTPLPITQDNLNVPVDAGWVDQATVCQGVEAGSVAVCG